ncbi:hypothetical protein LCGC14_2418800, partial [marine sediment metagenome]
MSNTYTIKNSSGSVIATINETQKNSTSTSLVLHGRGAKDYGFDRNQNLIYLMEHFSNIGSPGGGGPANSIDGQLWWNRTERGVFVWDTSLGSPAWTSVVPPSEGLGFNVIAGTGLTGGGRPVGSPNGSPLTTTLHVGAGPGIIVTADAVSIDESTIVHDDLLNYVANEHINHATVNGLSNLFIGGNALIGNSLMTSSVTFDVVVGFGVTANANDISIDSTIVFRTSGNQTITTLKRFTGQILGASGSASAPAFSFAGDTDTGFYRSAANELSFSTGGSQRFRIEAGGVLHSLNATYESLV